MIEPGVVICTDSADERVINEVCAGIEEEGVNFYFAEAANASEAADMSVFFCGIGISGRLTEVVMQNVSMTSMEPRLAGHNAGRFVKRQRLSL